MELLRTTVMELFAIDSVWSIVLRAGVWFAIAAVIIWSMSSPDPENASRKLKSNLGFFMLFLVLSGGLIYFLFGYTVQG